LTERDFKVKKGLTVTDDINVSGDINVSSLYGRLNFKKNAAGNVNNDAIYFINGSDQYAGAVKYFHGDNTLRFDANQATQLHISDGAIYPPVDSDVDLGTTSLRFKDTFVDSITVTGAVGRDAHNQIKFSTDDQIIFRVGNADGVIFKASGEIEATKFDGNLEGNADTATSAGTVGVTPNDAAGSFVNENNLIMFLPDGDTSSGTGNYRPESSTDFHYNPSTKILTVPKVSSAFTGNVTGTATNATAITLGGHLINDVDIGTELVDTDDHIMSSGAIKAYVDANGGGASALNDLSDVIASGSGNLWISPGDTPSHGTLSSAIQNISIGKLAGDAITEGDRNIAIGTAAGSGITTGEGNITIGDFAQYTQTTGSANVVVGRQALFGNGVKSNNTGFGHNALYAATTGSNNVALGFEAGNNITSGSHNVVIGNADVASATGDSQLSISSGDGGVTWITGDSSGVVNIPGSLTVAGSAVGGATTLNGLTDVISNITNFTDSILISPDGAAPPHGTLNGATDNVGIGKDVFKVLTSGSRNVGIGDGALDSLTSGNDNVCIGQGAGQANTNNNYNVCLGRSAGLMNNDGANVAVGWQAMALSTAGAVNVAIGVNSLFTTTGNYNVGIGDGAGDNITSGSNNVVIGNADVPTATGSSQLVIASGNGDTKWIEGNSDGIVLGALTPLFYERAALDTSAVDFRVPTVQSSVANPNGYPMPFAGKVVAASFLFAGSAISTSGNTNTIRIRKNGGTSGSDIKDFTFTEGDLNNTNGNQYSLVKSGSDVLFTFAAGDVIQVKRQSGSTDLNNSQAMLWVSYNF